jgi:hypothetical protein
MQELISSKIMLTHRGRSSLVVILTKNYLKPLKKKMMRLVFVIALSLFVITTNAQYSQQFRGTVTDQVLQQPLAGATVTISPLGKSVITDEAGVFRFQQIFLLVPIVSVFPIRVLKKVYWKILQLTPVKQQ